MDRRDLDWRYLGQGLKRSLLLMAAGVVLWGASAGYLAYLTSGLDEARQSLAGLEEQRNDLTRRRDARRQFAAAYERLQADGVVSGDQRLMWVQDARDAGAALGLPYLRYTTNPERVFEAPWLPAGSTTPVMVSLMELQMGLAHEQDLLRLFARLEASPGTFQVQSCNLERLGQNVVLEADRANVTGTCQLAWFSLAPEATVAAAGPEN